MINTILVQVDKSCSMARVSLNNKGIMEGNFWDFHPGCHGIYDYGDFRSYNDLASMIRQKLFKEGKEVEIINETYKYID